MQRKAYKKEQEYTKKTNEYTIVPSNNTVHNLQKKDNRYRITPAPLTRKPIKELFPIYIFIKYLKARRPADLFFLGFSK